MNYKKPPSKKTSFNRILYLVYLFAAIIGLSYIGSCSVFSVDPTVNYIIEEGKHYSNYYNNNNKYKDTRKKLAPILIRGERLEFDFTFTDNHKYDHTVKNGEDINKLYGITSKNIHENSARIGWRYIGNNVFEVYAYYYVNGVPSWKLLYNAQIYEPLNFVVDVSGNEYAFGVNGSWANVYNTKNISAFRSFPYFGGNNTAPHKMYFIIVEL